VSVDLFREVLDPIAQLGELALGAAQLESIATPCSVKTYAR